MITLRNFDSTSAHHSEVTYAREMEKYNSREDEE